ncbi:class I SAM-dependent methyltransferase [Lihuaxuella thermophila]|uniref:Methyltransferase domain-containing protein n=1 Tax=Lihuaxuella thermophila TaxID=1173111 RepID=A0A1H8GQ28_9BACL|nr:methyltransferase domain-containing protein [Lihuaxuella thermophila]SEN46086.1 Methyltransferase domain-containing protein [Lihuaxuella thermophila]
MPFLKDFFEQFRQPSGFWGRVAGKMMSMTTGERNEWTLALLDIQPGDRVLEVGYGPGVGIEKAVSLVQEGEVVGLDASETMRSQAEKRNRRAISEGKVRLLSGKIEEWPGFEVPFDKIYSVNSAQFWPDRPLVLKKLFQWLGPGGRVATTYQQIGKNVEDPSAFADRLTSELAQAGFVQIRREYRQFKGGTAVCVIAHKPVNG